MDERHGRRPPELVVRGERWHYGHLLLLVVASTVAMILLPDEAAGAAAGVAVLAVTVIVALSVTGVSHRRRRAAAVVVAVPTLVVGLTAALDPYTDIPTTVVEMLARLLGLGLAFVVPWLVVRDLLRHPAITLQTVAGTLCVYLLLGLGFASAHGVLDALVVDAYTRDLGDADAVYLSFVTLTTVGFGDVTPVAGSARAVTVLQAVVGQLYLVSVVALVVGNLGTVRSRHGAARAAGDEASEAVAGPGEVADEPDDR